MKKGGILVQVTSPHNRGPLYRTEWCRDCSHSPSFVRSFFRPSSFSDESFPLLLSSSFSASAAGFPPPIPLPRPTSVWAVHTTARGRGLDARSMLAISFPLDASTVFRCGMDRCNSCPQRHETLGGWRTHENEASPVSQSLGLSNLHLERT